MEPGELFHNAHSRKLKSTLVLDPRSEANLLLSRRDQGRSRPQKAINCRRLFCPTNRLHVSATGAEEHSSPQMTIKAPNYLGVSRRFASSCTDFVVADLSIADLVGRPQAAGGFVICLANTR
jgi:hypothetical protein